MNVFISYAREDKTNAKKLYLNLRGLKGVIPWLDIEQLLPGIHWEDEIMKAMQQSHLVVLLLSSKSISKEGYVQKETREALERLDTFPPGKIFVVPARLDECSLRHPRLQKLHWVDMFPDWEDGFSKIVRVIDRERPSPPEVSAPSDSPLPVLESISSRTVVELRITTRSSLRGADLMDLDLRGLDFSGLDLSGACLIGCRLDDCRFVSSQLRGANFERAVLQGADLEDADLWGVNFWRASLSNVRNLLEARIDQTNFWGVSGVGNATMRKLSKFPILDLGNYGVFVDYFRNDVGLTLQQLTMNFLWLNHHYFRAMFKGLHHEKP